VTADETWVHHYEPESKMQSIEWKHPSLPTRKKCSTQPSSGKIMFTIFGTHWVFYWKIIRKMGIEWIVQDIESCWSNLWSQQFAKTTRAIITENVVVTWQCVASHYWVCYWGAPTSCLQSRSRACRLSYFWASPKSITEACGTLDKMYRKGWKVCEKVPLILPLYIYVNKFK